MMKKLYNLFFLLLPVLLNAQPQGKLFVHTVFVNNNELGYIQYPQNQYHSIDATAVDDMLIINNKLLVTNNKIYFYDISTHSRTDSINTANALLLGASNNKLAVVKSRSPYFEVYDLTTKNLIFSLDSTKVKSTAVDMLLDAGKAYLLFDTSIEIIDLNLQDSLANIAIFPQFSYPAYSQYLVNKGNKVYIEVELATGAPRFAIFSILKSSLQITYEKLIEFVNTPYKPVLSGNKIYMSSFPSYFDILADTFIYNQTYPDLFPVNFDENSQTMFLYQPQNLKISYFYNNSFGNSIAIPSYLNKTAYFNEGGSGIFNPEKSSDALSVFPNPAAKELNIELLKEEFVKEIRIYSLNGIHFTKPLMQSLRQVKMDITQLAEGYYFIEVQLENQIIKSKFIKSKPN
jgi:hypothetical protein